MNTKHITLKINSYRSGNTVLKDGKAFEGTNITLNAKTNCPIIEKATDKIKKELNLRFRAASKMAENLYKLHPNLFPIIEAWLEGTYPEFEYEGITLMYIMEKERTPPYVDAIFTMSLLMQKPDMLSSYKQTSFYRY